MNTLQIEQDLCARDPQLLGLPSVLDAKNLVQKMGFPAMEVVYLRYKPNTSCVAGLISCHTRKDAVAVMTYPKDRYAEVKERPRWNHPEKQVIFLDDIQTVIVPLAQDRNLRALRSLLHPEHQAAFLEKLGIAGASLQILRYKPGRRVVFLATTPDGKRSILKIHAESGFTHALCGAHHGATHTGAPIIGQRKKHHVIAMEWLEGEGLETAQNPALSFLQTGQALAQLHKKRVPKDIPSLQETGKFTQDAQMIGWILPNLAPRITKIAHLLEESLLLSEGCVILHGDFSADQVILSDQGVRFVDWDRIAAGSPAQDLGTFLANLDMQHTIKGTNLTQTRKLADAFLDGYRQENPLPPDLPYAYARALFALLLEGFRARHLDWVHITHFLLAKIEDVLSTTPLCSVSSETYPVDRTKDILGLYMATNLPIMQKKIASLLETDIQNLTIQIVRHKPNRRALILYEGKKSDTTSFSFLGKIRKKGTDLYSPAIYTALKQAGLDQSVAVPAVIGQMKTPAIWFQDRVQGQVFAAYLEQDHPATPEARRVGHALATLHKTAIPTPKIWTHKDELRVLEENLQSVDDASYQKDLAAISSMAKSWIKDLPDISPVGLHRDFYFDQVLLAPQTVWLVDLDLYAIGNPAIDIGNFLAHNVEFGLRRHKNPAHFSKISAAFLDGYQSLTPLPDHNHLFCFFWVSLARHIGISRKFKERQHITGDLIKMTHQAMEQRFEGFNLNSV